MLSRLLNWTQAIARPTALRGGAPLDLPTSGRPTVIPTSVPTAPAPRAFSADAFRPTAALEAIRQDAQRLMTTLPSATLPSATVPAPAGPVAAVASVANFAIAGLGDELAALGATLPTFAPPPAAPAPVAAPYINQYHPDGEANGYTNGGSNCGPTSMAMIARAFGYGQGLTDAQLINQLGGFGHTTADGTSVNGIAAMAQAIGKTGDIHGPGPDTAWIAEQLRAGKLVVANGDYYAMGSHDRSKIGSGGHYVAVIGLDADGNFLVDDPADNGIRGRAFTPEALAVFIKSNNNGGYQIAIG